jgi:hypothetical protein
MAELNEAMKGPVEMTLADGQTYRMAVLVLDDWITFCEWVNRTKRVRPGTPIGLDSMLEEASTALGMRYLAWLSLRQCVPEIKVEEVGKLVGSLARLTDIFKAIADLPDSGDDDTDPTRTEDTDEI